MTAATKAATQINMDYLNNVTLQYGEHGHPSGTEVCALEAINFAITGKVSGEVPEGVSQTVLILAAINDGLWPDDNARTEFIRPFLLRFATLRRDHLKDRARVKRVVHEAIRIVQEESPRFQSWDRWAELHLAGGPDIDDAMFKIWAQAAAAEAAVQYGLHEWRKALWYAVKAVEHVSVAGTYMGGTEWWVDRTDTYAAHLRRLLHALFEGGGD